MQTEKDLVRTLTELGIEHELITTEHATPSVIAAAEAMGESPESIVKSLLFANRANGDYLLVLAQGLRKVDKEKLSRHTKGDWRLASPDEVAQMTGYAAGTVPPVGLATNIPVVMDSRVHAMNELIAGGGGHTASLRIARRDVERLTKCSVHDVCFEA
ncbi:MAG: aminoacyl-tRNA deacylase [Thermoplasmatota archaeon]